MSKNFIDTLQDLMPRTGSLSRELVPNMVVAANLLERCTIYLADHKQCVYFTT
jgi:hypothetical protein